LRNTRIENHVFHTASRRTDNRAVWRTGADSRLLQFE
jgi:hypothetical protein